MNGLDLPYRALNDFYRAQFGQKVYKISVKHFFTCPNRDGSKGTGGCVFCSAQNLIPATYAPGLSISEQIAKGAQFIRRKYGAEKFIVYFQDFSATYAPVDELEKIYREAVAAPDVVGLAVGTRPDCFNAEVAALLKDISKTRFVQLELGLQSASDESLRLINRGHTVAEFVRAHALSKEAGLHTVSHVIIGFDWEACADHLRTVQLINEVKSDGVKFHALHVIKDTALAQRYAREQFKLMSREEYAERIVELLELLDPRCVVHRLTAETEDELLIAPAWVKDKHGVIDLIRRTMRERKTFQGRLFADAEK